MTDVVARIGARVDAIGAGDDRTAVISGHERNTSSMMDWPVLPVLRLGRYGNHDLILFRLGEVRHDHAIAARKIRLVVVVPSPSPPSAFGCER